MLTRLLAVAVERTRWTVLIAVAVLAGATGGVWAATNAAGPGITVTNVADDKGEAARGDKPDKPKAAKKSSAAERNGQPQGVHGACVSVVARSSAIGGENGNHGGAVSRAAHTCSPNAAGTERGSGKPSKAPKPPKPTKSPKPTASADATSRGGQPSDPGQPTGTGGPGTGGQPSDLPTPTTTPSATATTTATATATATP